jgi:hypothetical protein
VGARKKKPAYAGQNRVSDIPVLPWHRSRFDAAEEAVAHDKIRSGSQFSHKSVKFAEVITVIGIGHDTMTR